LFDQPEVVVDFIMQNIIEKVFFTSTFLMFFCTNFAMQEKPHHDVKAAVKLAYQELKSDDPRHRLEALTFILQFDPCSVRTVHIFERKDDQFIYWGQPAITKLGQLLEHQRMFVFDTQRVFFRNDCFAPQYEIFVGPKLVFGCSLVPKNDEYAAFLMGGKKTR